MVAAMLLIGCIYSGPWKETVVINNSDRAFVAQTDDYGGTKFILVRPGRLTSVDSQGEMNSAATQILLWDLDCTSSASVPGHFEDGGVITIAADGSVAFAPGRTGQTTPTELDSGLETCIEAAAQLD